MPKDVSHLSLAELIEEILSRFVGGFVIGSDGRKADWSWRYRSLAEILGLAYYAEIACFQSIEQGASTTARAPQGQACPSSTLTTDREEATAARLLEELVRRFRHVVVAVCREEKCRGFHPRPLVISSGNHAFNQSLLSRLKFNLLRESRAVSTVQAERDFANLSKEFGEYEMIAACGKWKSRFWFARGESITSSLATAGMGEIQKYLALGASLDEKLAAPDDLQDVLNQVFDG
jgi:hypothetical protein